MVQRGRESYKLGQFSDAAEHLQSALELLDTGTGRDNEYYLVAATLISYMVDSENYAEARTLAEQLVPEVEQGGGNTEALIHVTLRYAVALELFDELPDDHVRLIEVNVRLEEIATASGSP